MSTAQQSMDNLDLPRSIIGRVIKGALPEGAQVQKDAKAAMTKACTVFINYLTATALDVTKHSDRKSINANDIFRALAILEFDQFLPMIKVAVQEFQQKAKEKRQEYKRNFKEKHAMAALGGDGQGGGDGGDGNGYHDNDGVGGSSSAMQYQEEEEDYDEEGEDDLQQQQHHHQHNHNQHHPSSSIPDKRSSFAPDDGDHKRARIEGEYQGGEEEYDSEEDGGQQGSFQDLPSF
ncbi:hypothetical protein HKX48_009277 [Thoreauomyces humboldtii]|nr:hypothetical protein HKX48_009277 [Thoreauomyces humboldtii]